MINPRDFLESNHSAAAMLRDSEAEIARLAVPLLDLRTVPREQWDALIDRELTLPPGVSAYLSKADFPLPTEHADAMTDSVARFHGITAPYYVDMSTRFQKTGRAWAHVAEAAPFVSGFYFSKEQA